MSTVFSRAWTRAVVVGLLVLATGTGALILMAGAAPAARAHHLTHAAARAATPHAGGASTQRAGRASTQRATRHAPSPISIEWRSPRDGSTVRGIVAGSACQVTVHDVNRITRVTFGLDGTTFRTDTAPPYTCQFSAVALSRGMHIVQAKAYDAAGNALSNYIYVSTPWNGKPRITVTVQGDSLTVGSWWRIPAHLGPGYDFASFSARSGRPSGKGLELLRRQRLGRVVVFALGTNDWWAPAAAYRRHLASVLHLIGPRRCLVLATIWRGGASNRALNAVVYSIARRYGPARVQLAHWSEAIASGRVRVSPDGTHPNTGAGWDGRAAIIASAIRACAAH